MPEAVPVGYVRDVQVYLGQEPMRMSKEVRDGEGQKRGGGIWGNTERWREEKRTMAVVRKKPKTKDDNTCIGGLPDDYASTGGLPDDDAGMEGLPDEQEGHQTNGRVARRQCQHRSYG